MPWAPETPQVGAGAQAACDLYQQAIGFLPEAALCSRPPVLGSPSLRYAACILNPRRSPGEASCVGPWAVAAPELPPRSPNQRGSAHPKLHSPKLVLFPQSGTALSPLSCASPKMPHSTDPGASEHPTTGVWRSAHTQAAGIAGRPWQHRCSSTKPISSTAFGTVAREAAKTALQEPHVPGRPQHSAGTLTLAPTGKSSKTSMPGRVAAILHCVAIYSLRTSQRDAGSGKRGARSRAELG